MFGAGSAIDGDVDRGRTFLHVALEFLHPRRHGRGEIVLLTRIRLEVEEQVAVIVARVDRLAALNRELEPPGSRISSAAHSPNRLASTPTVPSSRPISNESSRPASTRWTRSTA